MAYAAVAALDARAARLRPTFTRHVVRASDRDGPRGWLYSTHTIVTPPIVHEKEFVGIRVTPNV